MTDLAQGRPARPGGAVPSPASIRSRAQAAAAGSGRATARAVLDEALSDIELAAADRRFLVRLSQWDKRSAARVASLISRARRGGPGGAALTAAQLQTALTALADAYAYRTSGSAAAACWDCANLASGLCEEHAGDADRAHAFAELAAALSGAGLPGAGLSGQRRPGAGLQRLDAVAGFRRQAAVAS